MTQPLLVLANSYKNGARCLAGIDEVGEWVRPVADSLGAGVPGSRLYVGGRAVAPGDCIELVLGEPVPLFFQRENMLLGPETIVLGRVAPPEEIQERLRARASDIADFASEPRSYVDASEYDFGVAASSLALLRTESIRMTWRTNMSGILRPRAVFEVAEGCWDLPFTGEQWDGFPVRTAGSSEEYGPAYITVSVGESVPGSTQHYFLAAGVLPAID